MMRKIYSIKCKKYNEFKKPKISYICDKTLLLSSICNKWGSEDEKMFKEEESIEILKILGLINKIEKYHNRIVMPEEKINQEIRLKKIDEIRNYLIQEIKQTKLMTKKHKKICRLLNYIDHPLIVISTITGRVSIFAFAFLVDIPMGITSSAIGLKICVITAAIRKYKLIIKKRRSMIK